MAQGGGFSSGMNEKETNATINNVVPRYTRDDLHTKTLVG
jgi:hypothetical protein